MRKRIYMLGIVAVLAVLLASFGVLEAATLRVPSEQPNIRVAIEAATEGDTVLVAPGTYTGEENWNYFWWETSITLLSEAGPLHTILDGGGNFYRCFNMLGEDNASRLEGFTFQNARGALSIDDYATPVIRNCIFRDLSVYHTTASVYGGAIVVGYSAPTFQNCLFIDNQVRFLGDPGMGVAKGGALSCQESYVQLRECTFVENGAFSSNGYGTYGRAVFADESEINLVGCSFFGNAAIERGGGLCLWNSSTSIENSIIAFSGAGEGIGCSSQADITVLCADVFGNEGGDWIDCIADQLGVNGNISEDPLFCDAANNDFTLDALSPCAPENSAGCGLIGAWPVGCGTTAVGPASVSPARPRLTIRPNPIVSSAEFVLGEEQSATLEIYDPVGRLVERLGVSGSATWTPGRSLRSGVYFARLQGAGESQVVRFIVLR